MKQKVTPKQVQEVIDRFGVASISISLRRIKAERRQASRKQIGVLNSQDKAEMGRRGRIGATLQAQRMTPQERHDRAMKGGLAFKARHEERQREAARLLEETPAGSNTEQV